MVVMLKSNGKVRVCDDLSKLNGFVKWENYFFLVVDMMLGRLVGFIVFIKFDVNLGFW